MTLEVAVAPAGDFIARELSSRGWTRAEFAEILGRPPQFVSEVITGKKEITRESAAQIGAAFNTSPDIWLTLQDRYFLWHQQLNGKKQSELSAVRLRARLKELAPIAILRQRRVITSPTLAGQAEQLRELLELQSIDDSPTFAAAARRSNPAEAVSATQVSWLACVRRRARALEAEKYDRAAFIKLVENLSNHLAIPENFRGLPELFAAVGVRVVYIEAFPSSKLDGCSFMLDGHPIIGLSGRGKRLDKVLFTILHEAAHIVLGHVDDITIIDDDDSFTMGEEKSADTYAVKWILPGDLVSVPERISSEWIEKIATSRGVHPIVVIGRLQNQGRLTWRTSLVKGAPSVTRYLEEW
jgi:HTH-type transcriptional regulator / antitoxin HigA